MDSEHFKVHVKLENGDARVSEVHLAPGHATPQHAHRHAYVVHPRAATTVRKTTFKDGQVVGTEEIAHKPGEPYFVAASEDGMSFTLENVGSGPMLCDKTFIKK